VNKIAASAVEFAKYIFLHA